MPHPTMFFIRPAPGIGIADPVTGEYLPVTGMLMPRSGFWLRRLKDKDVEVVPEPLPDPRKSTPKHKAAPEAVHVGTLTPAAPEED